VLLANMPQEQAELLINGSPLIKLTPFTIDSIDILRAELDEIRRTSVAFSDQESVPGVGAVAAAVRNANGSTIAAINVVFPFHLVNQEERATLSRLVVDAARRLSHRVGCLVL
jgi:DNA-binding IclR family transcriptional regulator